MKTFGLNNTYSSIHPVLKGDNPDNSFTELPYEKGFQLLSYIESILGESMMEEYITYHIDEHTLHSITAYDMRATFARFVEDHYDSPQEVNRILSQVSFNEWIYKVSLDPTGTLNFDTQEGSDSAALAMQYISLNGTASPDNYKDYFAFYSNLKVVFHDTL